MSMKKAVALLHAHSRDHKPNTRDIKRVGARAAAPANQESEIKFALNYLETYGYLENELAAWKDITITDLINAIKKFQNLFGLTQSGNLCAKAVRAMQTPRCGCPDFVRPRHGQYEAIKEWAATNLPSWQKRGLKYAVQSYVPGLQQGVQDRIFEEAFGAWTQYGQIAINRTTESSADIVLSTGSGARSNFDGAGGVLAWAYLPDGSDGQLQMKFDLAETWLPVGSKDRGIFMLNVATHEFGHLFGLDHSRVQSALMAPYYNAMLAVPQQNDDIPRFQARYGIRPPTTPPVPPTTPPTLPPTTPPTVPALQQLVVNYDPRSTVIMLNGKPVA